MYELSTYCCVTLVSNVGGGKEALLSPCDENRCFYGEEEKLYIIRRRTIVVGI